MRALTIALSTCGGGFVAIARLCACLPSVGTHSCCSVWWLPRVHTCPHPHPYPPATFAPALRCQRYLRTHRTTQHAPRAGWSMVDDYTRLLPAHHTRLRTRTLPPHLLPHTCAHHNAHTFTLDGRPATNCVVRSVMWVILTHTQHARALYTISTAPAGARAARAALFRIHGLTFRC